MGVVRGKDRIEPERLMVSFHLLLKLTREEAAGSPSAQSIAGQRWAWVPWSFTLVGFLHPRPLCEVASRGDISHPDAMRPTGQGSLVAFGHSWWLSECWESKAVRCLAEEGRSRKEELG